MTMHAKLTHLGDLWDLAADWIIAIAMVVLIVAAVVVFLAIGALWLARQAGAI